MDAPDLFCKRKEFPAECEFRAVRFCTKTCKYVNLLFEDTFIFCSNKIWQHCLFKLETCSFVNTLYPECFVQYNLSTWEGGRQEGLGLTDCLTA